MKKYEKQIKQYEPKNDQEISDKSLIEKCILLYGDKILTREVDVAHITASVLILNPDFTKVLMAYHNIYQSWAWTGGHADGEEDLFYVAKKEAMEETGIKNFVPLTDNIVSIEILPVYGHIKRGKYVSAHLHLNVTYVLIVEESEEVHNKPDENKGVMWIKIDELEKYSSEEEMIPVYKKIIDEAKKIRKEKSK